MSSIMKKNILIFTSFLLVYCIIMGCSSLKYSQHIDSDLRQKNLNLNGTFIVFPIEDVTFNVPPSIFYSYSTKDRIRIEQLWNSEIKKNLRERLPQIDFDFISEDDSLLVEEDSSIYAIKHIGYESGLVRILDPRDRDEKRKEYFQKKVHEEMKKKLLPYQSKYNADYAVIFVNPYLHFTENYYENESVPTISQFYGYSSTVEIQIWDITAGSLLFDSGTYDHRFFFNLFTLIFRDESTIKKNASKVGKILSEFISTR